MRCEVQHRYASNHNGRYFGPWVAGEVVQVDDADVEWVNHDSPGTLVPEKATEKAAEKKAEPAAKKTAAKKAEPVADGEK